MFCNASTFVFDIENMIAFDNLINIRIEILEFLKKQKIESKKLLFAFFWFNTLCKLSNVLKIDRFLSYS